MMRGWILLITAAALPGCSLAPAYVQPALPVPPSWPAGDAYLRQSEAALPSVSYRDVFRDPRLQAIIDQALANNRDLRVAVANIAAARAQYRIQRGELFPALGASAGYTYGHSGGGSSTTGARTGTSAGSGTGFSSSGGSFSVNAGVTAFELDLFGRVRSLTDASLNRYFEQEAAGRATRLTLVGDVAGAWLTYAADRSLLKVSQDTAASAANSVRLTDARLKGGIAPRTDLAQAQQVLATAEASIANQTTLLAQDINALQLLVGAPVDTASLPASIDDAANSITELPAGLDSTILLRRPDVVQAEYELRATNGDIGAARAALFPRISLTGLLGFASSTLSSLFTGGAFSWSAGPSASYSIFQGGAARAGVDYSQAQRDAALATYEKAIQSAFRDVADALARRGTISAQLDANQRFAAAASTSYRLADARYRGGIDTFLASLDAQRQLYSAQQALVQTRLVRATNLVTLYRALGGDSQLESTPRGSAPPAQQSPQQ